MEQLERNIQPISSQEHRDAIPQMFLREINWSEGFPNMVLSTEYSEAVNARYTFQPLWVSFFIQRLLTLNVSFGFHGLPLLTFKTDQLHLRGLDLGKSVIILLNSLKFQRVDTVYYVCKTQV